MRGVDNPVIAIDTTSKVNARTKEDGFGVTAVHKLNVFENTTGVTIGSAITSSGTTGADISGMKMLQGIASIMTEDQKDNVLIYADKPVQEYNAFAKSGILPDYSRHIPNFQFPLDQIVIVTTEVGCDTACAALLAAKLPVMFDSETFYDPATKQNSHVANLVQLYTGKGGAGSNDICYLFQVHAWGRCFPSFARLFSDDVKKVAHFKGGDIKSLQNRFPAIEIKNVTNLLDEIPRLAATATNAAGKRSKSLADLVLCSLGVQLPGKKTVDHTCWRNVQYTDDQKQYAANDAVSMRRLMDVDGSESRTSDSAFQAVAGLINDGGANGDIVEDEETAAEVAAAEAAAGEEDDDGPEHTQVPGRVGTFPANAKTAVFDRCVELVHEFHVSEKAESLELPIGLDYTQRTILHSLADDLGLNSFSSVTAKNIGGTPAGKTMSFEKAGPYQSQNHLIGSDAIQYLVQHEDGRDGVVVGFTPGHGDTSGANHDSSTTISEPKWMLSYPASEGGSIGERSARGRRRHAASADGGGGPASGGGIDFDGDGDREHYTVGIDDLNAALRRRWKTVDIDSTVAAATTPDDGEEPSDDHPLLTKLLAGCDPDWNTTSKYRQVKYDGKHWATIFGCISGASQQTMMHKKFSTSACDTAYGILCGEVDRIIRHYQALGMTIDQIARLKRKSIRKFARTHCPEPTVLIKGLYALYNCFKDAYDPDRPGKRFFVHDHERLFIKSCRYVQLGLLSDPPGRPMYVFLRTLTTGLALFRCLRSSSQLEASHLKTRLVLDPRARHASMRYKEAATGYNDFR